MACTTTLVPPETTKSLATFFSWRRFFRISFKMTGPVGPSYSVDGRMAQQRSNTNTEVVREAAFSSIDEKGTHRDSSVGLNISPFSKLIALLCSLVKAAYRTGAYGSFGTTHTSILKTLSTEGTRGNTSDPTMVIGGKVLSGEFAALSSRFPVGVTIAPPSPRCSWLSLP